MREKNLLETTVVGIDLRGHFGINIRFHFIFTTVIGTRKVDYVIHWNTKGNPFAESYHFLICQRGKCALEYVLTAVVYKWTEWKTLYYCVMWFFCRKYCYGNLAIFFFSHSPTFRKNTLTLLLIYIVLSSK